MRKKFPPLISVVLCVVIVLNLFAGSVLSILLNSVEGNYGEGFSGSPDELVLIKIPVHSSSITFQKLNDHELFYNKKLFDVVRSYVKNDVHYFYCLNDTKEERMLESIQQCLESHLDYYNSIEHPGQIIHQLFTVENFYLSPHKKELPQTDFVFHFMPEKFPQRIWFETAYPPPDISIS